MMEGESVTLNTDDELQITLLTRFTHISGYFLFFHHHHVHHHHVEMLSYYKTLKTNLSSNIFNCCVYRAAADTFVNDFTWIHCASCLFNTSWFIYTLIGLTFLTHPPNRRKRISNPVAHLFQETCRSTRKPYQNVGHRGEPERTPDHNRPSNNHPHLLQLIRLPFISTLSSLLPCLVYHSLPQT